MWGIVLSLFGCPDANINSTDLEGNRPDIRIEAERSDVFENDVTDDDVFTLSDAQLSSDTDNSDTGGDDTIDEELPTADIHQETDITEQVTLYPAGRILSPIHGYVADNLRKISFSGVGLSPNVFMKVGASSTVSSSNLVCFGGPNVQLDENQDLQPTIDFFLEGDAAGTSPFERQTLAAKIGMSAGWAITGSPSPLDSEIEAINPSYALVHYGTNDMGLGATYESAIWKFGDRLGEVSDELIARGIVPVLMAIASRGDKAAANRWVGSYNAVIRGIAQKRQVPFLDLHYALEPLAGEGLAGDGIHLNTYKEDGALRPCVFTPEGLAFGMNMRNLISLMALDALRWTVALGQDMVDDGVFLDGLGTLDTPFIVPHLPFSDSRDTSNGGESQLNTYTGCDAEQNEAGPEYMYRFTLDTTRRIRAMVFDHDDTDIDLHLLNSTGQESGCLARDHQIIEGTLPPGTYYFALDTFVSGGLAMDGEYLFVLVECDEDDAACNPLLLEESP